MLKVEFEEFLAKKKVDTLAFKENDPEKWSAWLLAFSNQHPASFLAQKLYLINAIRRKYPYQDQEVQSTDAKPNLKSKPKFTRSPKKT